MCKLSPHALSSLHAQSPCSAPDIVPNASLFNLPFSGLHLSHDKWQPVDSDK